MRASPLLQLLRRAAPSPRLHSTQPQPHHATPGSGSGGARTPTAAALLGAAGLVPFIFYAAQHSHLGDAALPRGDALLARVEAALALPAGVLPLRARNQEGVRRRFVGYGACILSFMGAVHWGVAMKLGGGQAARYTASVLPALLGWSALCALDEPDVRIRDRLPPLLLAGGFLGVYAYDELALSRKLVPSWYSFLRTPLTLAVVGSCLAAAKLAAPPDESARRA